MTDTPVRMTLRWSILPVESQSLLSVLQRLMVSTRLEPGCVGCTLSTDMGPRVTIDYVEEWSDEENLKRQLRSRRFSVLAELMEQTSCCPTVKFALAESTRGLDYAEEVRNNV
jgi:quinol monooxygenase YgiN